MAVADASYRSDVLPATAPPVIHLDTKKKRLDPSRWLRRSDCRAVESGVEGLADRFQFNSSGRACEVILPFETIYKDLKCYAALGKVHSPAQANDGHKQMRK
jgi:hypothetical protein